jgi:hypothetical protein
VRVDCFLVRTAFSKRPEGRHPHFTFEAFSGFTHVYGPSDRSVAQGQLRREAPALLVSQPNRSSAAGSIDNSPGGIFPPLMVRAFGAHGHKDIGFTKHAIECRRKF